MDINKKPIYPVETWNVTEKEFDNAEDNHFHGNQLPE